MGQDSGNSPAAETLTAPDPVIDACDRASQERKRRLGGIQRPKPAAEGG